MERTDVDLILSRAAQLLLSRDREPEGAMHLFQLAGRFVEVLEELSSQLASVLIPPNTSRGFWLAASKGFFEKHLRSSDSIVIQRILESGRNDVIQTFQVLLNLADFIDLSAQGR